MHYLKQYDLYPQNMHYFLQLIDADGTQTIQIVHEKYKAKTVAKEATLQSGREVIKIFFII